MRPSSKTAILDAALRLAERKGITSLTLDAAAQEAGLSKGGLIYHFATKEQLMLAVVEHITRSWDEAMRRALGKPFEDATAVERVLAYTRVVTGGATRADLAILTDSVYEEQLLAPWRALLVKWVGTPPGDPEPTEVDRVVARLAADGLWVAEASDTTGFGAGMRDAVVARIHRLAGAEGRGT
ncbi:TetR/AcrR family transcriptional regulator [Amycolatopsis nigrescens]|uniref:TetR/AcrR family transcriptional regulator n=1 Tax=Amycolatopsis nigrescens TaxID=381445 RepID=UPI00035F23DF|nr:TetR/AcrR family transcriptional regulator [Amycolatopsis nigrescens]